MIAHDLDFTGNIIPMHSKLKNVFCLSNWHSEYFSKIYPLLKDIVKPFGYGIDSVIDISNKIQRTTGLVFIYSSFPIRGLLPLLQMWPKILERYPGSILHIHSDIEGWWSNSMRPDEMKEIKTLLDKYRNIRALDNSLKYHGWTSKEQLYKNWKDADIWFYPCTYLETFCHTALEAAISKTFIITTDLGALRDTVGDRGVLIKVEKNTDFYDEQFQNKAIISVFESIDNIDLRNELVEKNYKWVQMQTWKSRADVLLKDYLLPALNSKSNNAINTKTTTIDTFSSILEYIKWKNVGKQIKILEIGGQFANHFSNVLQSSKIVVLESAVQIEETDNIQLYEGDTNEFLLKMIKDNFNYDFIYANITNSVEYYAVILNTFKLLNKGGIISFYKNHNVEYFTTKYKEKIKIISEVDDLVFIEKL